MPNEVQMLLDAGQHLADERTQYDERAYLSASLILSNLAIAAINSGFAQAERAL